NVFMTVEVLKDTSEFVDTPPTGTVYRNLNIWLGNVVKKSDITDATISFGVSKSWLEENGFDPASIRLLRYTTEWTELPTTMTGEDDDMVYYTAETPGFSIFSIVTSEIAEIPDGADEIEEEDTSGETTTPETEEGEGGLSGLPGFEAIFAIAGLLAVAYFVRRRESE
ncbi:MAG: PGF-pre-PGF domain-containing protein, partial [Euryarchaeota archaeon]|nr:PGF-pre-PGF domain-containing protein [Euryarchaeota archaeon]